VAALLSASASASAFCFLLLLLLARQGPADVVLLLGLALDTCYHCLLACGAAGLLAREVIQPVLPDISRHALALPQNVLLEVVSGCFKVLKLPTCILAMVALGSWAFGRVL
jgi:hypothetical protein